MMQLVSIFIGLGMAEIGLKFSDRLVRANSADPDQTAPRGAV